MSRPARALSALAILLTACSSPTGAAGGDAGPDAAVVADGGSDVGVVTRDADEADAGEAASNARNYCEDTVDMFCAYYLRCGRIAAADMQACRDSFLETCNAVYEPQYVELADRGQLELSPAGIAACAAHLETVECARQVFDLDGPCQAVWRGLLGPGESCAVGIGSFVCARGTECVLDLSLCGTCQRAGAVDEPCVDDRCAHDATCVDGTCIARGLPGDMCDDVRLCATGLACEAGTCAGRTVVAVNDACDASHTCPYQSSCLGGVCVTDALLGESCTDANCASGWCDGTICRAFITPGDPCGAPSQCLSGVCDTSCAPPISACF